MAQRIKSILFDLGDTLLDFGKVDIPTLFEAGARLAYEYLKELGLPLPSFARYHRQQLWAVRWAVLVSRLSRREFNALTVIDRLARRMGHDLNEAQRVDLAWCWYEPLSRCAKTEDDLHQTLGALRDQGLMLGLVSNTFIPAQVLDRHLEQERLIEYLPVRVYSCDVRYRKPHRSIFRIATEQTGVPAGQTLFVGDSPAFDIAGANRCGMVSVLKDPNNRHARHKHAPRHRIARIAELPDLLKQYNS